MFFLEIEKMHDLLFSPITFQFFFVGFDEWKGRVGKCQFMKSQSYIVSFMLQKELPIPMNL